MMKLKDQMRQNTIPIYLIECSLFIGLGDEIKRSNATKYNTYLFNRM